MLDRESSELDRLNVQVKIEWKTFGHLSASSDEMDAERESMAANLRRALGISVVVDLVPEGIFDRTQFKSRRVIDNRGIWRIGESVPSGPSRTDHTTIEFPDWTLYSA